LHIIPDFLTSNRAEKKIKKLGNLVLHGVYRE